VELFHLNLLFVPPNDKRGGNTEMYEMKIRMSFFHLLL